MKQLITNQIKRMIRKPLIRDTLVDVANRVTTKRASDKITRHPFLNTRQRGPECQHQFKRDGETVTLFVQIAPTLIRACGYIGAMSISAPDGEGGFIPMAADVCFDEYLMRAPLDVQMAILAHEAGHVLNGDLTFNLGVPLTPRDVQKREIAADRFSMDCGYDMVNALEWTLDVYTGNMKDEDISNLNRRIAICKASRPDLIQELVS